MIAMRQTSDVRSSPLLLIALAGLLLTVLSACQPPAGNGGGAVSSASSASFAAYPDALNVYFNNEQLDPAVTCDRVFPVARDVSGEEDAYKPEALLLDLFAGPTEAELAEGYTSLFSEETDDMLLRVRIAGATAYVDLDDIRPIIPNASSSCGSASFLAQVGATLGEFGVTEVRYAIDGDPAAFYEWMQIGCPAEGSAENWPASRSSAERSEGWCDPAPFMPGAGTE